MKKREIETLLPIIKMDIQSLEYFSSIVRNERESLYTRIGVALDTSTNYYNMKDRLMKLLELVELIVKE